MTVLLLILNAVLALYIIFNAFALKEYRRLSQNAIRSYSDNSRFRKAVRCILCVLCVLTLLSIPVFILLKFSHSLDFYLTLLLTALFLGLYGFVPFSAGTWCITGEGVYIYRVRKLIPWTQIIRTGAQTVRKRTFLTLQVKKQKGEMFKQVFYSCRIPADEVDEARQIIREFLHTLDRQRLMKKRREEQSVELKDRRFY